MAKMKYFPAYFTYTETLSALSDEQVGKLFRALLLYAENGTVPRLDGMCMMAFGFIRGDIDRMNESYEKKCAALQQNGMKGGRPPKQTVSEKPNGFEENQMVSEETKKTYGKGNSKEKDNGNGKGEGDINASAAAAPAQQKTTKKQFVPPTVDEVREYCNEQGLTVDAERFVDYYEANGWKVGNQAMKDWKAAVRNWARRDRERGYTAATKPAQKFQPGASSFDTDDFFDAALMRTYGDNWEFMKAGMDG